MANFDEPYVRVPAEQKRLLQEFRANHPYKEVIVDGGRWRYIACGQGNDALPFLPGGFLKADMWFYSVRSLEGDYRIVVPDAFALQDTFGQDDVCAALVRSLDVEGIEKAAVIGISAGGGVHSYAALVRELGVIEALLDSMIEDLVRLGYLRLAEGTCPSRCEGCPRSGTCGIGGGGRLWVLTERGVRATEAQGGRGAGVSADEGNHHG